MEFRGTFQVTKKDNIRYNLFLNRKKMASGCILIFLILFALMFLASRNMVEVKTVWTYVVIVLIALAAAGVYAAYSYFIRVKLRINNSYKTGLLKDFQQEVTVDRNGVRIASEQNAKDIAFKYIWFVHETKRTFYLFVADNVAVFLSKEQIPDLKDIATLRAIFAKYMHPKKLLLRKD